VRFAYQDKTGIRFGSLSYSGRGLWPAYMTTTRDVFGLD
jgi:hypothetical protein